jgi:hypothetical protein
LKKLLQDQKVQYQQHAQQYAQNLMQKLQTDLSAVWSMKRNKVVKDLATHAQGTQ